LWNAVGDVFSTRTQWPEAEQAIRKAIEVDRMARGADHPDVGTNLGVLARILHNEGRMQEARTSFQEAIAIQTRVMGPDHPKTLATLTAYADFLRKAGELAQAEEVQRGVLRVAANAHDSDSLNFAYFQEGLALTLYEEGKFGDAEGNFRAACGRYDADSAVGHAERGYCDSALARLLVDTGRAAEAEPLARKAFAALRAGFPAEDRHVARAQSILGYSLLAQHRLAEAEPELRASYAAIARGFGVDARDSVRARKWIERLYAELGKPDEARKLIAAATQDQGPRNIR
jgi:tetratricopeptide (TPR) repeat protein